MSLHHAEPKDVPIDDAIIEIAQQSIDRAMQEEQHEEGCTDGGSVDEFVARVRRALGADTGSRAGCVPAGCGVVECMASNLEDQVADRVDAGAHAGLDHGGAVELLDDRGTGERRRVRQPFAAIDGRGDTAAGTRSCAARSSLDPYICPGMSRTVRPAPQGGPHVGRQPSRPRGGCQRGLVEPGSARGGGRD